MRIAGYIGTYNESIERPLAALLGQTYAVPNIVVVDNASVTDPLSRSMPEHVTVIRTPRNIGTSSGVAAGLRYALDHGYEWLWLLDSDGAPYPDALQKLVELYESFDEARKRRTGILCCTQILLPSTQLFHGRRLTPGGPRLPIIEPRLPYCECDAVMWNGALINMETVRVVGLPRLGTAGAWEDLSYDYGDIEFTYRIKAAGYDVLTHLSSFVNQRTGHSRELRILGRSLISTNHPPARRYLFFRNLLYFWVHVYPRRNWVLLGTWLLYRLTVIAVGMALLEEGVVEKLRACFAGIRDGMAARLDTKYDR